MYTIGRKQQGQFSHCGRGGEKKTLERKLAYLWKTS